MNTTDRRRYFWELEGVQRLLLKSSKECKELIVRLLLESSKDIERVQLQENFRSSIDNPTSSCCFCQLPIDLGVRTGCRYICVGMSSAVALGVAVVVAGCGCARGAWKPEFWDQQKKEAKISTRPSSVKFQSESTSVMPSVRRHEQAAYELTYSHDHDDYQRCYCHCYVLYILCACYQKWELTTSASMATHPRAWWPCTIWLCGHASSVLLIERAPSCSVRT